MNHDSTALRPYNVDFQCTHVMASFRLSSTHEAEQALTRSMYATVDEFANILFSLEALLPALIRPPAQAEDFGSALTRHSLVLRNPKYIFSIFKSSSNIFDRVVSYVTMPTQPCPLFNMTSPAFTTTPLWRN
jgi:hypothetical protein